MQLRTRLAMPVLTGLRNLPFTAAAAIPFVYSVELSSEDVTVGVVLVSVELNVRPGFGQTAVLTKTITTASTASGQITDTGATDGVGAFHIDVTGAESTGWTTRLVFEVTVTDSLGRTTPFDAGYLVPVTGLEYDFAPVARVTIAPTAMTVYMGTTGQIAAVALDEFNVPLTNRIITRTTSNAAVATVNTDGVVTAVGVGVALITAEADGKTAYSTVTVAASLFDSFMRADDPTGLGITDSGHPWTVLAGGFEVLGNVGRRSTPSGGTFDAATVQSGIANAIVQATDVSALPGQGLTVRRSDVNNGFIVELNTTSRRLYRLQAGSFTQIGLDAVVPVAGDVVRVAMSGSAFTLYVNTVSTITATDAFNQSVTKHGYQTTSNTGTPSFDDFSVN